VLTAVDPETGAIEYKAQSPDEAALVQAAADVGVVVRGRDREILKLQTPFADEVEEYELLNILEFTSARKRMSVVLRKLDGDDSRLFLLSKGADNVIFERLREGSQELKDATEKDLDMFASEGLRTLTLAYKVIQGDVTCLHHWLVLT
jgi:phospholipid-translocating ATPase